MANGFNVAGVAKPFGIFSGAAWQPEGRDRIVSQALRAYAALTTSAARGAVRDLSQLD